MKFNYVTCAEIQDLESRHPLVSPLFSDDLRRFYTECPDAAPDFPILFYLSDDGSIVCRLGVLPDTMTDLAGNQHRWAWTGGLFTPPEHRGRGLATQLIKQASAVLEGMSILRGSVYSADKTLHIYEKLGGTQISFAPRYLFLKTVKPVLRQHVGNGFWVDWADALYRMTFYKWLGAKFEKKLDCSAYKVTKVEINDCREKINFKKYNKGLCFFNNDLSKLFWKLKKTKFKHDLYFIHDEGDTLVGYFVTRSKFEDGRDNVKYSGFELLTLVDFGCYCGDVETTFKAIFENVVRLFLKGRAEVLEIITSAESMKSCVKTSLFLRGGKGMSFTCNTFGRTDLQCEKDLASWHLTGFCGDAFTYK